MAVVTDGLVAEFIGKHADDDGTPHTNADADKATWTANVGGGYGTITSSWQGDEGWVGDGSAGDPYGYKKSSIDTTTHNIARNSALGCFNDMVFSYEAWVRFPSSGNGVNWDIMGEQGETVTNYAMAHLYVQFSNVPCIFIRDSANKSFRPVSPGSATYDDGGIHHLVGTCDGTTGYLFVDNSRGTGVSVPSGWTNPTGIDTKLAGWSGYTMANATLFTARFYSKALSSAEVTQNYNAGVLAASTDSTSSNTSALIQFGIA